MEIYKVSDSIIVKEYDLNADVQSDSSGILRPQDYPILNYSIIPDSMLTALDTFQKELNIKRSMSCTTEDNYIISHGSTYFKVEDGSCAWYGYDRLYKLFFQK